MHIKRNPEHGLINNQQENWQFKVNKVLHNATQEQVFDETAGEVIDSAIKGYNGTILAYGQTGAGKTYTMVGGMQNFAFRGLIPRTIQRLFQVRPARSLNVTAAALTLAVLVNRSWTHGRIWTL